MEKITSLFKRNYDGDRLVYDEVVPGAEWVLNGEGDATVKFDGTACMYKDRVLYKRYDCKLTKSAQRTKRRHRGWLPNIGSFKPAPDGWIPAENEPNLHTGHWPGWLLVDFDKPENKWHKEADDLMFEQGVEVYDYNGTYELVGPKVQGNPYNLNGHELWPHDMVKIKYGVAEPRRDFESIRDWLFDHNVEGLVWHRANGDMVKIKGKDFGFTWPIRR